MSHALDAIGGMRAILLGMQNAAEDPEHMERGDSRAVERFAENAGVAQAAGETELQFRARVERALSARPGDNPARWTVPL